MGNIVQLGVDNGMMLEKLVMRTMLLVVETPIHALVIKILSREAIIISLVVMVLHMISIPLAVDGIMKLLIVHPLLSPEVEVNLTVTKRTVSKEVRQVQYRVERKIVFED